MKEMIEELIEELRANLDDERFRHSLGVMKTAAKLAEHYNVDVKKAEIAGLLHDCAKCMDLVSQLKIAENFGILQDDVEKREGALLHAPVGAIVAKRDYGITDKEILNAIRIHTTGDVKMSMLEKIIFLSDLIEPERCFPGVDELRIKAFKSIDDALIDAFDSTIRYVLEKGSLLHPRTVLARNYILMEKEGEGKS